MWIYPKPLPEALRGLPARHVSVMDAQDPEITARQREASLLRARKIEYRGKVYNGVREAAAATHLGEHKIRDLATREQGGWGWVE